MKIKSWMIVLAIFVVAVLVIIFESSALIRDMKKCEAISDECEVFSCKADASSSSSYGYKNKMMYLQLEENCLLKKNLSLEENNQKEGY